jgi:sugar fermentation stimulation protein A
MRFPSPLVRATLVKRYKRFLADVRLEDGSTATAHVPNSGSMMGLCGPGQQVWLSRAAGKGRRLPYTLELVRDGRTLVGINTGRPNALVAEALAAGRIPELAGYASVRREVPYGRNSRIDLLLEGDGRPPCYVEVKNVHLRRRPSDAAEFPDSVTARGAKHLDELARMVAQGRRAVMLYVVQRGDCRHFRLADDIDPAYAEAFARARGRGVEALCYGCKIGRTAIELAKPISIDI